MIQKIFLSFFIFLVLISQDIWAENKKIYLVHWLKEGRTSIGDNFINYLQSKYADIEFIERFVEQDIKKIPGFISEIRKLKPDLIYVYGTTGTLAIAGLHDDINPEKHITDIPIIAVAHSEPVGAKIVKEIGVPTGRNLTGVGHYVPVETIFNLMKEYTPSIRKIGVLISDEQNAKVSAQSIENLGKKEGFETMTLFHKMEGTKIANGSIDESVTQILQSKPDMIYLPSDDVNLGNIKEIITSFVRHKDIHVAPIFTTAEPMIITQNSCTFAIFTSGSVMGMMAGMQAEDLLFKDKKVTEIPYSSGSKMTLVIRKDTMNEFKVYPLISLLETAKILK